MLKSNFMPTERDQNNKSTIIKINDGVTSSQLNFNESQEIAESAYSLLNDTPNNVAVIEDDPLEMAIMSIDKAFKINNKLNKDTDEHLKLLTSAVSRMAFAKSENFGKQSSCYQ